MFRKIMFAGLLLPSIGATILGLIVFALLLIEHVGGWIKVGTDSIHPGEVGVLTVTEFTLGIALISQVVCLFRLFKGPQVITVKNGITYYPTRKLAIRAGYVDAERIAYVDNAVVRYGWLGIRDNLETIDTANAVHAAGSSK